MDLSGIISVSGMGGLFKIVAQTKNGLLVESLADGKRQPIYSSHKVSALNDISIYGLNEDIPLKEVLAAIRDKNESKPFEGNVNDQNVLKASFAEFVPQHDRDRVYTSDIKKVLNWYNLLLAKDLLKQEETAVEEAPKAAIEVESANTKPAKSVARPKETAKAPSPKASSKAMAKTPTVRKTGG